MRKNTLIVILTLLITLTGLLFGQNALTKVVKTQSILVKGSITVVFYFHRGVDDFVSYKFETYTKEAIYDNFSDELIDRTLLFKAINVNERLNKHYIKDYQLYAKSVVLAKLKNGQIIKYKNLDKVWSLFSNRKNFQEYIKSETANFLKQGAN